MLTVTQSAFELQDLDQRIGRCNRTVEVGQGKLDGKGYNVKYLDNGELVALQGLVPKVP